MKQVSLCLCRGFSIPQKRTLLYIPFSFGVAQLWTQTDQQTKPEAILEASSLPKREHSKDISHLFSLMIFEAFRFMYRVSMTNFWEEMAITQKLCTSKWPNIKSGKNRNSLRVDVVMTANSKVLVVNLNLSWERR